MGNQGATPFQKQMHLAMMEYVLFWIHCMVLIIFMHGIYFTFNPNQRSRNASD